MNSPRNYLLKKISFNNLLFNYIYSRQLRQDEDFQYENDCYFNDELDYLYI